MSKSQALITDPASALEALIVLIGVNNPTLHRQIETQITVTLLESAAGRCQIEERHLQSLHQLKRVFSLPALTDEIPSEQKIFR